MEFTLKRLEILFLPMLATQKAIRDENPELRERAHGPLATEQIRLAAQQHQQIEPEEERPSND